MVCCELGAGVLLDGFHGGDAPGDRVVSPPTPSVIVAGG
jgi:hypothetical protein